jgi:hypothetical protein
MLVLLITGILKYKDKVGWGGIPLIHSHKNEVTVTRGEDGWSDSRNCNVVQEGKDSFMNCTRKVYWTTWGKQ